MLTPFNEFNYAFFRFFSGHIFKSLTTYARELIMILVLCCFKASHLILFALVLNSEIVFFYLEE